MTNNSILRDCSIRDIYCNGVDTSIKYQIPVYQRNYAWERNEIVALIKDVKDSWEAGKGVYYIGTLVTYNRGDDCFEVIDGQQRLTTIYIILRALGVENIGNSLTYSARKASDATIKALKANMDNSDWGDNPDRGIKNGYDIARKEIESLGDDFKNYFLDSVHIIHYQVPQDVDLNHYFEVMNSRGEQLEKHEILKAQFCNTFTKDLDTMAKFTQIWEACSAMGTFVQKKQPKEVFNDVHSLSDFDKLTLSDKADTGAFEMMSIADMLNEPVKGEGKEADAVEDDTFQPIIDFPNFLLIVLKITLVRLMHDFKLDDFTLDDKELLNEFAKVKPLTPEFAKIFAINLLKAKYYLDNYVVHHINGPDSTTENPWKLQKYILVDKDNGKDWHPHPKELAAYDKDVQNELVHLLSMFEVTFTAKQRKNYLFYCLLHLFEDDDVDQYLKFLRGLANKYFIDVYLDAKQINGDKNNQPKPNSFDEVIMHAVSSGEVKYANSPDVKPSGEKRDFNKIYPEGSMEIPLFIFNYTDYKLWRKYAEELRGEKSNKGSRERRQFFDELGCSDFELDVFNKFYFSRTRKSLEHYFPQANVKDDGSTPTREEINCFGNFAMIGADANSSGSNSYPIEKEMKYLGNKTNPLSVASLKFRIMLQICEDNNVKGIKDPAAKREDALMWNADDIRGHQEKMLKIIMSPLSSKV